MSLSRFLYRASHPLLAIAMALVMWKGYGPIPGAIGWAGLVCYFWFGPAVWKERE